MTFRRLRLIVPVLHFLVHRNLPKECWPEQRRPLSRFSLTHGVDMDGLINIVSSPLSLQLTAGKMQIDVGSA
jgi:hypothetical protein